MTFVERAFQETNGFARPFIEHAVTHPYDEGMIQECLVTLRDAHGSKIPRHCRIYCEGRLLNPFEAKDIVRRVADHGKWYSGIEEAMGTDDFLIFLNMAGLYSISMARASKSYVADFDKRFEPSGVSIEHHVIIGRYRETPFGVHVDDATDRVFHFNLGPAVKTMRLWPRRAFLERYDRDAARPLHAVAFENSTLYEMRVGGGFLLPADFYHVGSCPDNVSAVVSLAFSRQSARLILQGAIRELQTLVPRHEQEEGYFTNFLAAPRGHGENMWQDHDRVGLCVAAKHAAARRRSNSCFTEIASLRTPLIASLEGTYRLLESTRLEIVEDDSCLYVYSAGHRARLTTRTHVRLLDRVLADRSFAISCDRFASRGRDDRAFTAFLAWLVTTGVAVREETVS